MNWKMFFTIAVTLAALAATPRAQEQEPIRESVSVVNVEVPVRVFADGEPVSGLGKEDFEISEGGKPQPINGFTVLHKTLAAAPAPLSAAEAAPAASRYFVLIFRTYDFNDELQQGLQYLFAELFRPEDQLLVMANSRTLAFERLDDAAGAQGQVAEVLRAECQRAHNQLLGYVRGIEQNLNMTQFKLTLPSRGNDATPEYIEGFLRSYMAAWKDFKRNYLSLELDKFYYFARHLEKVRREKWVLNFYQLEQFPQIAMSSEFKRSLNTIVRRFQESENPTTVAQGRILEKLMQDIDGEMNVARDFPAEEVSKLFYKVNATFHSFFMRVFLDSDSNELQFRSVASDIENSLRELTRVTGGTLASSNDLDASLAAAAERADDCYVLTYEPANPKKVGKIKVKVKGRGYKVVYDDNIRADYISAYLAKKAAESPAVKVSELSFQDRKLSFVISDFALAKVKDKPAGVLSVRIRVTAAGGGSAFDQTRDLHADRGRISLSLGFASLPPGKYDIVVDVLDRVSGKTCTEVIQPVVR